MGISPVGFFFFISIFAFILIFERVLFDESCKCGAQTRCRTVDTNACPPPARSSARNLVTSAPAGAPNYSPSSGIVGKPGAPKTCVCVCVFSPDTKKRATKRGNLKSLFARVVV